jgi:hypothetical protein
MLDASELRTYPKVRRYAIEVRRTFGGRSRDRAGFRGWPGSCVGSGFGHASGLLAAGDIGLRADSFTRLVGRRGGPHGDLLRCAPRLHPRRRAAARTRQRGTDSGRRASLTLLALRRDLACRRRRLGAGNAALPAEKSAHSQRARPRASSRRHLAGSLIGRVAGSRCLQCLFWNRTSFAPTEGVRAARVPGRPHRRLGERNGASRRCARPAATTRDIGRARSSSRAQEGVGRVRESCRRTSRVRLPLCNDSVARE